MATLTRPTVKIHKYQLFTLAASAFMILGAVILLMADTTPRSVTTRAAMPNDAVHAGVNTSGAEAVNDFVQAGLDYAEIGDVAGAIQSFEIALAAARGPEAAVPHYYLGVIYAQFTEFENATTHLQAAIELNPEQEGAWMALGSVHLSAGRPVEAVDAFTEAITRNPENAAAYSNRGQAYARSSVYERALADFDKAIELNPQLIAAYYNRGAHYFLHGEAEAAIADFTTILDIDPTQANAHFNRAAAYRELGETQSAIDDLVIFIAFQPGEEMTEQAQLLLAELRGVSYTGEHIP